MKNDDQKEDKLDMLARLVSTGFDRIDSKMDSMQGQITGMQGQITGMQGQMNGMQDQITELRDEMRTGFSDLRLEIRELNRRVDAIELKLAGMLESLDNTVLKSEFLELKNKVLALEAKFT